ncbi:hypothetical protein PV729_04365 [Streptomyces europaeiscabiei]|uniref:DUF5753 domain-containing protein n=1 Tax=Streptomyces europaeiscabiei TaxID=146819 RepID=A0ABU4N963_9ACTN|nr:hypothetical protein [Streptomyces europaeiscabiei]MDX3551012.1 hypothetical protein [Streptomyces europaeiscabiei]MDX3698428.1 hypothetical protein [Streptomyces europaeiscabiei]
MRAVVACERLEIELTNVPGGIDVYVDSGAYENSFGRMTLEEAKELRSALDILISAAEH